MIEVRQDDLGTEAVRSLLAFHRRTMVADSPPCHAYALDLSALASPDITLFSAWQGDMLCGVGALRHLDPVTGEIKSMRTHPDHLGRGVGAAVLAAIIDAARVQGLARLSLETGTGPTFDAALGLYRSRGFVDGPAFSDYVGSDFNQFLHLDL